MSQAADSGTAGCPFLRPNDTSQNPVFFKLYSLKKVKKRKLHRNSFQLCRCYTCFGRVSVGWPKDQPFGAMTKHAHRAFQVDSHWAIETFEARPAGYLGFMPWKKVLTLVGLTAMSPGARTSAPTNLPIAGFCRVRQTIANGMPVNWAKAGKKRGETRLLYRVMQPHAAQASPNLAPSDATLLKNPNNT